MSEQDAEGFEALVAPHRAALHAHCYRMLGSLADADDALQDALLGAWRGMGGFAGRGSLKAWLYRVTTNACLQLIAQRPRRLLSADHRPAANPELLVDPPIEGTFIEPYPDNPGARYEQRESVELAFIAALQHLPGTQRAVLILSDVMEFSAAEVAEQLDTSVAAVTSALQRARKTLEQRLPAKSQQATLRDLGEAQQHQLVTAFVTAWERKDVPALLALLTEDARFTMPPIPNWFDGREAVGRFLAGQVFATDWRLYPMRINGQLAFACYQGPAFRLGALNVLTLRDRAIVEMTGFLDPVVNAKFRLPDR